MDKITNSNNKHKKERKVQNQIDYLELFGKLFIITGIIGIILNIVLRFLNVI